MSDIIYPTNVGPCPVCHVMGDRDKDCQTCKFPTTKTRQSAYRKGLNDVPYRGRCLPDRAAGAAWSAACRARPTLLERVAISIRQRMANLPATPASVDAYVEQVTGALTKEQIAVYDLIADQEIDRQCSWAVFWGPEFTLRIGQAVELSRRLTNMP